MHSIAIIGGSSNLSKEILLQSQDIFDKVVVFSRSSQVDHHSKTINVQDISTENISTLFSTNYDIYLFNLGVLYPYNILDQTEEMITTSLKVNALFTVKACEYIFNRNQNARVFIIGSESGKKGSFDTTYFLSKSILRSYVMEKYLAKPNQQLLLISPSTIDDASMTINRTDIERLETYRSQHPKGRFLNCFELAQLIVNLFGSTNYMTNCELEVNGGKFARMKY